MLVSSATAVILAISASVQALPLRKRIAQTISASTAKWEKACLAAGGGEKCNPISVTAFSTLLAAAGPCEQQNSADAMIDLAKTLKNDPDMISSARIFAQQPRNTPTSQSVLYCQTAPKNKELDGLFQCQFAGADQKTFVGGVAVGGAGTIPFGLTTPLAPAGSCAAHPDGPVPDGQQLSDITQDPGVGRTGDSGDSAGEDAKAPPTTSATEATNVPSATGKAVLGSRPPATATPGNGSDSTDGIQLQNGKDAQALNAKFAGLAADSECEGQEQACILGSFAQCAGGKFVPTPCPPTLSCFALPLVNKKGTSISCTKAGEAADRISASGATGGITGEESAQGASSSPAPTPTTTGDDSEATSEGVASSTPPTSTTTGDDSEAGSPAEATAATSGDDTSADASSSPQPTNPATPAASPVPPSGADSSDFKLQNGKDAQALNAKFASLTASSPCSEGDNACVDGGFAQCVGGKFAVTTCAAGLRCAALPLVNKPGTSIACTTEADAEARIAASGATGGVTGA
ncbi:hypothetical protein HGRIS_004916 [Hohenbuehelia grisea]|uniref:Carbohydrate-binding module family 19 domain-containing protein n=1 Tax=Hohenbuehelia grisea TaxID=104357 RepID=A0ABR3JEQ0_9AGAR